MAKIPLITHQIWFQGWRHESFPEKYNKNVEALVKQNPTWEHKKWDEKSLAKECAKISVQCKECFDNFPLLIQKVDFGRLAVLYNYGGVSIDCDQECVKPLEDTPEFKTAEFIISKSVGSSVLHWFASVFTTTKLYNNATIMTVAKNEKVLKIIHDIMKSSESRANCMWRNGLLSKTCFVTLTTGPVQVTKSLQTVNENQLVVLNPVFLESPNQNQQSILVHRHEQSWINPVGRYFHKMFLKHPCLVYPALFLLFLPLIIILATIFLQPNGGMKKKI